jgi:DNA-binding NarL/FixJ family response regulator
MARAHRPRHDDAMAPIRVFLADDSQPIRDRVRGLLNSHCIDVIGEASSPSACIAGVRDLAPDVVVLDVHLQGGTGLQVLRDIRRRAPQVVFVVLSNNAEPAYRLRYLGDGASAFLDKSTEFGRLPEVVTHAHALSRKFSKGVPLCP